MIKEPRYISKLNKDQALEIRALYKKIPTKDLAKRFSISRQQVRRIAIGHCWKHLGGINEHGAKF